MHRKITSLRLGWLLLVLALVVMPLITAYSAAAKAVQVTAPDKLYTFESGINGFNTKSYFYDTGREVIAFDTQFTPEIAQESINFLRAKTSNPITYVVLTHPNPDKFNGISVFQNLGAKVIASRETVAAMSGVHEYKKYYFVHIARMFTEETYPALGTVDVVFDQTYTINLNNGEAITLQTLPHAGVSSTQTIAIIPAIHAVMVGDLIHYQAHAWLEGGIVNGSATPTLAGWQADLQALKVQFADPPNITVYGGRGKDAKLDKAVDEQLAYLQKADEIVTTYIAQLGSRKAELQGPEAGAHYDLIQKEFEAAFPNYQLGYMIKFGVYGLVNSKL